MYILVEFLDNGTQGVALKKWLDSETSTEMVNNKSVYIIAYPPKPFPKLRKYLKDGLEALSKWNDYRCHIICEDGK